MSIFITLHLTLIAELRSLNFYTHGEQHSTNQTLMKAESSKNVLIYKYAHRWLKLKSADSFLASHRLNSNRSSQFWCRVLKISAVSKDSLTFSRTTEKIKLNQVFFGHFSKLHNHERLLEQTKSMKLNKILNIAKSSWAWDHAESYKRNGSSQTKCLEMALTLEPDD